MAVQRTFIDDLWLMMTIRNEEERNCRGELQRRAM